MRFCTSSRFLRRGLERDECCTGGGEQWCRVKPYHVPNSPLIFFRLSLDNSSCLRTLNLTYICHYRTSSLCVAVVWLTSHQLAGGGVQTQDRYTCCGCDAYCTNCCETQLYLYCLIVTVKELLINTGWYCSYSIKK